MESSQKILIDGYNLIHADHDMKRLIGASPDSARSLLLDRLRTYVRTKCLQITVVFDGRGSMLDTEPVVPGKLQILFSRERQSADDLIIAILEEAANAREYLVVTSDNEDIGRVARGLGAQVIDSPSFLKRIARTRPSFPARKEKPAPADDDLEYWLRKFSKEE